MALSDHITVEEREIAGRLVVSLRGAVDGAFAGRHRNARHGAGTEFSDHRPYSPGDDPRRIDWKAVARNDRLQIRRYEDESALRVHLVVDRSASMGWGEGVCSKKTYAARLAAILGCAVVRRRDFVAVHVGGADGFSTPCGNTVRHLENAVDRLVALDAVGTVDLAAMLAGLAPKLGRRALVILISDLLTEPEPVLRAIASLRTERHDVIAYQTLAPAELDLSLLPAGEFTDLETGARLTTDPASAAADYRHALDAFLDTWRRGFAELRADHRLAPTATPPADLLHEHLSRRERSVR